MVDFNETEGEQFVKAAGEGDARTIMALLDRYNEESSSRYLMHGYTDAIFEEGALAAAENGHVEILRILYGYGAVQKRDFPVLVARKQFEVLDWLMNKEQAKTFVRFGGEHLPLNARDLRRAFRNLERKEECHAALKVLEGYFPKDITAELRADIEQWMEYCVTEENSRKKQNL